MARVAESWRLRRNSVLRRDNLIARKEHAGGGSGSTDTANVGNAGSVQGILGTLNIENPPNVTDVTLDDSADATAQTVTLSSFSPNPVDSQGDGDTYINIHGLAPAEGSQQ